MTTPKIKVTLQHINCNSFIYGTMLSTLPQEEDIIFVKDEAFGVVQLCHLFLDTDLCDCDHEVVVLVDRIPEFDNKFNLTEFKK